MNSSKVDFISNLLAHKNIRVAEKERLFMLTREEVTKLSEHDAEKINELVKRIEKLEGEENAVVILENKKTLNNWENVQHKPKQVTAFLKKFKDNTVLKFTTHIWDETKYPTIQEFIDDLNKAETKKDFKELFNINRNLFNLLNYYLYVPPIEIDKRGTPQFGWVNFNDIKIGWQYPNQLLINWCKKNGRNPLQFPLPDNFCPQRPIKGSMITTFENIVEAFKTEIQFRENYMVKELNKRKNRMSDFTFVGIEELSNVDFYTYTSGVLSAIDTILEEIKKNETAKTIIFRHKMDESGLVIDITQANSFPTRRINRNNLSQFLGGGLNAIAGSLFGLCDFSVISQFKDENNNTMNGELLINYDGVQGTMQGRNVNLTSQPKFQEYNELIHGFTYSLKFYL